MPKPRRDAVHRYYLYDASSNTSKCNLCGNSMKGKHTTNLKNHMSVKHSEEYLIISNINKENIHHHQPSTSRDMLTSDRVKHNCVKLLTIHGRPFTLIQDKAFQEIINIAVPSNAHTKQININTIKGMIPEKAYQIRLTIASEIRHILISLKLDSATYLDRNFLGINLQYIKEGKITVRNLAVLEVLERQTGDFLKEKVLEILDDFKISTAQIYSITTDNGSNFKKMTKLLTEHCSTTTDEINVDNNDFDDENEGDEEDDHNEQVSGSDTHNLDVDSLLNTMSSESFKPRAMLCAAHTLQLVVKDAIAGNIEVQICLELTRKAAKILRRPNMKNVIRLSNLNKPLIDCPTRWTSTYQMLVRLVSLRDICESHSEVSCVFSSNFWEQIIDLVTCFKPINDATLALQREQLTISDFYMEWLNCKAKVESIRIEFASELAQCMKARESDLLNADLVLENLYLDGRLNVVLSDQESAKAQILICETFRQLQRIRSSETVIIEPTPAIASSSQHDTEHFSDNSVLEKMLQETETRRGLPRSSLNSFEGMLSKLRYEPRIPLHENIIAHWANKGSTNNPLIVVANCVLAAPATQVSVERLFSSVKYILNPLRSNISGSLLQDIMLIRSNRDLFD